MASGIRMSLRRAIAGTLALAFLLSPLPAVRPAAAATYVTDSASHPPPTSGAYAYYATYGTFGPGNSGFPGVGGSFEDPVFGRTIRRLTNEVGQTSNSEIYSRNGWSNADGTIVHHRGPNSRMFVNSTTGQVVRSGVPGNYDSSFAPDDPDTWYYFAKGTPDLMRYSVASGQSTKVTTFPGSLGDLGGSTDWIDRSGRYMVLNIGGSIRLYDKQSDTLYSGSINGSFGGGWAGISPDGNYVLMSRSGSPTQSQSYKVDHANKSVSTSAVTFWTLCGGHADAVTASNGKTYWVSLDCHSTAALYAADVTIPQSSGDVQKQLSDNKKLIQLSWSDDIHISRISRGVLQDWVVLSVEGGGDGFTSTVSGWYPYKQEILMVNVLTGEVRRLAHHRSRGDLGSNYYAQPRVSSSWDGSRVFWTSNFGHSQNGYSDLYVLETGDGGGSTPPPTDTLTASFGSPAEGATVSGTTTVGMSATGGSGSGYSYVFKVDGTTVSTGPASYSWNTASVANGSHTLSVTATDSAGASATATRTVTVSNTTTPPPSSLTVGFTNPANGATISGTVTVSMTAGGSSAGTAAVYTYTVKAGTATIYTGTNGSFSWNTTTVANGVATLTATVTDGNGGTGSATRSVTVSNTTTTPAPTAGDTVAPAVSITRPTGNVWTGNSIDIIATATDNTALSKIELWGNGSAFKTVTCTGTSCDTGTVWWSTGALTGAAYEVVAVAYDAAGNKTLSAPKIVYKTGTSPVIASGATGGSTTPPPPPPPATITASFTSPAAGATVSGTVTVGMSVSGGTGDTTFTLTDGSSTLSTQTVSGTTASYAWNTTGVANGGKTLTLTAVRGGATSTVTRSVTVSNTIAPPPPPPPPPGDTTPPTVRFTKPSNNAWTGNSLDVAATASDDVKLKSIQLYGNDVLFFTKNCNNTSCKTGTVWWRTGSLGSGKHTLKAVATDAAGNTTSTSITINK